VATPKFAKAGHELPRGSPPRCSDRWHRVSMIVSCRDVPTTSFTSRMTVPWNRGLRDANRCGYAARATLVILVACEVLRTSQRSSILGYESWSPPRPLRTARDRRRTRIGVVPRIARRWARIDYLEGSARVRDRRGARTRSGGRWTGSWDHTRVNRHGEPHLHDHVWSVRRPKVAVRARQSGSSPPRGADALYRTSLRQNSKSAHRGQRGDRSRVSNTSSVSMRDIGRSGEVITRPG